MVERVHQDSRSTDLIRQVCFRCEEIRMETLECRLLLLPGQGYLQTFEGKPCRPRDFVRRLLEGRLRRQGDPDPEDHAEDLAQDLLVGLAQRNSIDLLSPDLGGFRRFLAGRAAQVAVDHQRRVQGRMRCGNCRHHHHESSKGRICRHPDPAHPWQGRKVPAALDPRSFEPPCSAYEPRRKGAHADVDEMMGVIAADGPSPDAELVRSEAREEFWQACAAVQKQDPQAWNVVYLNVFRRLTLEEVSRKIGVVVRTITRRKQRGIELLQTELQQRGITFSDLA